MRTDHLKALLVTDYIAGMKLAIIHPLDNKTNPVIIDVGYFVRIVKQSITTWSTFQQIEIVDTLNSDGQCKVIDLTTKHLVMLYDDYVKFCNRHNTPAYLQYVHRILQINIDDIASEKIPEIIELTKQIEKLIPNNKTSISMLKSWAIHHHSLEAIQKAFNVELATHTAFSLNEIKLPKIKEDN
jgi:hypothetical protein